MEQTFEIFINELVSDEELRTSFLVSPRRTLQRAGEWGLPLSDSEIRSLITTDASVWDRVAEELDLRLQKAA
jgi:hypothetical protein